MHVPPVSGLKYFQVKTDKFYPVYFHWEYCYSLSGYSPPFPSFLYYIKEICLTHCFTIDGNLLSQTPHLPQSSGGGPTCIFTPHTPRACFSWLLQIPFGFCARDCRLSLTHVNTEVTFSEVCWVMGLVWGYSEVVVADYLKVSIRHPHLQRPFSHPDFRIFFV